MDRPLRILIAEDDELQSRPLELLIYKRVGAKLAETGIQLEVVVARTLEEAIRLAPEANVTILDLGFPDSDPVDTILSINKFRPPVIVITGHDDPELWASCRARGADHVFLKGQIHGICSQIIDSMIKDVVMTSDLENIPHGPSELH